MTRSSQIAEAISQPCRTLMDDESFPLKCEDSINKLARPLEAHGRTIIPWFAAADENTGGEVAHNYLTPAITYGLLKWNQIVPTP